MSSEARSLLMYGSGVMPETNVHRVVSRALDEEVLDEDAAEDLTGLSPEELADDMGWVNADRMSDSMEKALQKSILYGAGRTELNKSYRLEDEEEPEPRTSPYADIFKEEGVEVFSALGDTETARALEDFIEDLEDNLVSRNDEPEIGSQRPVSRRIWEEIEDSDRVHTQIAEADGIRMYALEPSTKPGLQTGFIPEPDTDADGDTVVSVTKPFASYVNVRTDREVNSQYHRTVLEGFIGEADNKDEAEEIVSNYLANTVVPELDENQAEEFEYESEALRRMLNRQEDFEKSIGIAEERIFSMIDENSEALYERDEITVAEIENEYGLDLDPDAVEDDSKVFGVVYQAPDWFLEEVGASENEVADTYWQKEVAAN